MPILRGQRSLAISSSRCRGVVEDETKTNPWIPLKVLLTSSRKADNRGSIPLILTAATGHLRITIKVSQLPSSCLPLDFILTPPTSLFLYIIYLLSIGLARQRVTTRAYPICLHPAHGSGDANAMADGKATCFKGRDGIHSTMDVHCATRQLGVTGECYEGESDSGAEEGSSRYVPVCAALTTTSLGKCQWSISRI